MPDAPDDPELTRLLDALVSASEDVQLAYAEFSPATQRRAERDQEDARAAIFAYLARAYVRRDRLHDDGPWEPGDGSPYAAALEAEDVDATP